MSAYWKFLITQAKMLVSGIRYICLKIVTYVWFERCIFLSIIISSLFLALSDYNCVDSNNNLISTCSVRNLILIQSEIWFVMIFSIEFLIKSIAFGMFYTPYSEKYNDTFSTIDFGDQIENKRHPVPYFMDRYKLCQTLEIY